MMPSSNQLKTGLGPGEPDQRCCAGRGGRRHAQEGHDVFEALPRYRRLRQISELVMILGPANFKDVCVCGRSCSAPPRVR